MYDEILDEAEELARSMSSTELAQLLEERGHALAPGAPGRSSWLCLAGERWEMTGDLARARAAFEEAVQDGGDAYVDPRAELVGVLLDLGDTPAADDLLAALHRDVEAGRAAEFVHALVGETLESHGRLDEALHWFSAGLTYRDREDTDEVDVVCLNGRYRVRRVLGLAPDRYDDLCEKRRRDYAADLEAPEVAPGEAGDGEPALLTVLYWPPAELTLLLDRWPELADGYGSDHAEHRCVVEHHLRELADHPGGVTVSRADFAEYLQFVEGRGDQAAAASTRATYAAHLGHLGRAVAWPPGRDEPCWCGSGQKYSKCCGALQFSSD